MLSKPEIAGSNGFVQFQLELLGVGNYLVFGGFLYFFRGLVLWFGRALVSLTFKSMNSCWLVTFNIFIFITFTYFFIRNACFPHNDVLINAMF